MMYRTCTVQVNLDFGSEADMVKKLRVALAAATGGDGALREFAVLRGRLNGHKSWRARIWRDLDASRTGMLSLCLRGRFRVRGLDSVRRSTCRLYFVYRERALQSTRSASRFRDFLPR